MIKAALFATPEDCARNFYEALARGDLDELMSSWADDEEICCVHPGAAPIYGYAAVRAAWAAIFRNNARIRLDIRDERWQSTIALTLQHAIEWIYVGDEVQPRAPIFAANAFLRTPQGWRMVSHHASPIQTGLNVAAGNAVLH